MASALKAAVFYTPSEIVKFFHSVPHYDLSFNKVSSDFRPNYQPYQEALLLIAAVPALWMLLWVVIYMIYFCYFCITCQRGAVEKRARTSRPERWLSFLFALLALLVVAGAMFGNEILSKGLHTAEEDLEAIEIDAHNINVQSSILVYEIESIVNESLPFLSSVYQTSSTLEQDNRNTLLSNTELARMNLTRAARLIKDIREPFDMLDLDPRILRDVNQYELYRRLGTHGLCGFFLVTLSLTLCSVGSRKKGFILMCVACVLIDVVLVWLTAGLYMGTMVASSDLCMDPTEYINEYTAANVGQSGLEINLAKYYLDCPNDSNPFSDKFLQAHNMLSSANQSLSTLVTLSVPLGTYVEEQVRKPQQNLTQIMSQLMQLGSFTDCGDSHRSYVSAVEALCDTALLGELIVLGGLTLGGVFLIILVFLTHTTARLLASRRAYFEVDSQDNNYQGRDSHNRSDNPLYYRFSQISTGEGDNTQVSSAQPTAPPRSSPPPAYQPHGDFYSTYGNNGTLDSNSRVAGNDLNRNSNTFRT